MLGVSGMAPAATAADNDDNIKVYVRIRPHVERELENGGGNAGANESRAVKTGETTGVHGETSIILSAGTAKSDVFTFDYTGGEETQQEEVFRCVGKVISDNCLQGYNGTIFCYGQTGSGKTYTMQGPLVAESPQENELRGIIPRCLEYLFAMMAREEKKFLCRASVCEIYNEFVYDLLDPAAPSCTIREDLKKGVYVDGISEEAVSSPEDAYRVLRIGAQNRHVAATSMNRESSRSHSIFTLVIQSKITDGEITDVRESRFNLVDLAGSERQKLTATTGMRLKEAGNINKSLLALGNVINALVDISNGKPRHVHYRDSKLTFLLRDSLGGNAKTFIIANISPSPFCYAETLSTLRFAQRAKMIKNRAVVNQEFQGNVIQLQEELKRLKHELLVAKTMATTSMLNADDLEMFQTEGDDSSSGRLLSLLLASLKRSSSAEKEKAMLYQKLIALSNVIEHQKQQIQTEKMVVKFRDSTIQQLRKSRPANEINDTEKSALQQEIASLKRLNDNHPEVTRFAAENLELRENIQRFEEYVEALQKYESQKAEQKRFELELSDKLIDLGEQLKKATAKERTVQAIAAEPQKADHNAEINKLTSQLQDVHARLTETEQREKDARLDLEASQQLVKELESSLEAARLSKELEMKRLKECVGTADSGAEITVVIEELKSRLANAVEENARIRLKYENMEKKSRRLSDFAAQSRNMSKEQLDAMSDRLEKMSIAKDETDAKNAELLLQVAGFQSRIDEHAKAAEEFEAALEKTKQVAQKERFQLESELTSLENAARRREEEMNTLTEEYQALRVELEDTTADMDFARSQLCVVQAKLDAQTDALCKSENALQDALLKISSQELEIQKLDESLGGSNEAAAELVLALRKVNLLEDDIEKTITESDSLRTELREKRDLVFKLQTEADVQKFAFAEICKKQAEERAEFQQLKRKLSESENSLESARYEIQAMQSVLGAYEAKDAHSASEMEDAKSRLVDLEAERVGLKESLHNAVVENEQLSVDVKDMEDKLRRATAQAEAQQRAVEEKYATANKDLRSTVERVQAELAELKRTNDTEEFGAKAKRLEELDVLEVRLAKLSQEYEESRAERNSEIQRLRDELAVAREGAQTAETQLAEFRTALSRVDALQEQVKLSEVRVQQLKIEKQKTEASLEMAQEDNLLLLDQVKALEESAEILKQSEHAEHLESELAATKKELAARDAALHAERARIQAVTESLSRFDEIQGQHKDLELLLDLFLKRNKNLEDENAKLVQHNNHKQKLQYHLQIKQENNQLRMDNKKLQVEVERLHGFMRERGLEAGHGRA